MIQLLVVLAMSVSAQDAGTPVGVTVRTRAGGSVEGVLVGLDDDAVTLKVSVGLLSLRRGDVARIELKDNGMAEFDRRRAAVGSGDVDALWALAQWAGRRGLVAPARSTAEEIVRLEPGHESARRMLGHEKVDGRWLPFAEAQAARGLVFFEDRWVAPSERDAALERRRRRRPPEPPPATVERRLPPGANSEGCDEDPGFWLWWQPASSAPYWHYMRVRDMPGAVTGPDGCPYAPIGAPNGRGKMWATIRNGRWVYATGVKVVRSDGSWSWTGFDDPDKY